MNPKPDGGTATETGELGRFLLVGALVFLSRLPFLGPGYGTLPDAWRVAWAAEVFATTGRYEASRFPGYPVQEIGSALFARGGPLALTGLTALLSALAAACFASVFRRLGSRDGVLAGLALASVPTLYIVSTQARDDPWALAFGLAGLLLAMRGQVVGSGIAAGLAIGSRITYGAWLIPLGLALSNSKAAGHKLRAVATTVAIGLAVGALAFLPVFLTYGFGFFRFYEHGSLPLLWIVKQASVDVWGIPGTVAITAALATRLVPGKRALSERAIPHNPGALGWAWAGLALFGVAYSRLPHHSVYLIPAIPFALLLLGQVVDRRMFMIVCVALIASPWVLKVSEKGRWDAGDSGRELSVALPHVPYRIGLLGPLPTDHARRVFHTRYVDRTLARARALPDSTVVVAIEFLPEIRVRLHGKVDGRVRYQYLVTEEDLADLDRRGVKVFSLLGADDKTREMYGFDLREHGVIPLHEEER